MLTDHELQATSRRLTTTLFIGQGLALAALFTTVSISSIAGVQLAGTERVAGWPSTATLIGGSLAAYPAGRIMGHFGRRIGLSIGYGSGIMAAPWRQRIGLEHTPGAPPPQSGGQGVRCSAPVNESLSTN